MNRIGNRLSMQPVLQLNNHVTKVIKKRRIGQNGG
ncbi:unknown [Porphyromonas sp. CAG:1061]|nr:unknown [Porphyromonas sp. CAG:1061]